MQSLVSELWGGRSLKKSTDALSDGVKAASHSAGVPETNKKQRPQITLFLYSIVYSRENSAEEYSLTFLWLLAWEDANSGSLRGSQGYSAS